MPRALNEARGHAAIFLKTLPSVLHGRRCHEVTKVVSSPCTPSMRGT